MFETGFFKYFEAHKKIAAEARLMNIIRQLTVATQGIRSKDIEYICDELERIIEEVVRNKYQRKIPSISPDGDSFEKAVHKRSTDPEENTFTKPTLKVVQ